MRRSDGEVWCVVRPDGRWNINTNAGTKTSRKTQADAEGFCDAARMDPSLLLPKTKSTAAPAGRSSRHAAYQKLPVKARAAYGSQCNIFNQAGRACAAAQLNGTEVFGSRSRAGPPQRPTAYGSLVTKKKLKPRTDSFQAVVNHLDRNPHQKKTVLGSLALAAAQDGKTLQAANQQLQADFDRTKRLLLGDSVFDPSGVANSKAIEAVLGDGYAAEQERTFRRHRHVLLSKLRDICADDTVRQLQLLQGCLKVFNVKTANQTKLSAQDAAAEQVLKGILDTLEKIKLLHGKGRTPHHLKVAQQTLQAAALARVDHVHSEHVSAMMLTSNRHQLLAAHHRGKDFLADDCKLPYELDESKCNILDPVWAAKVKSMWLSGTRPSVNKKDELKNPRDRSDPSTYSEQALIRFWR